MRAPAVAVALTVGALTPGVAFADPATAETLFREGRELFKNGETAKACALFADSQRLDPSSGTLINLGACREVEGKLASAWADFVSAARLARAEGKPERAEEADSRAAALETRVPHMRVKAPPNVATPVLFRDGQDLGVSAFDQDLPVDPGSHLLEVRASGRVPWSTTIEAVEGKSAEVAVPELDLAPVVVPPRIESPASPPPRAAPKQTSPRDQQVLAGWLTFGAGAVIGSAGAVVGGLALASNQESEKLCESRQDCEQDAIDAYDRADALAWAADILIPLGVASAAAGVIVVLTTPDEASSKSRAMAVRVGAHSAMLSFDAAF